MINPTLLDYSEIESDVYGLKVARANLESLNTTELVKEICSEGYDICRLRISTEKVDTVLKLKESGMPFFFSASIRRYRTAVKDLTEQPFIHANTEYEKYDGSQTGLLYEMLKSCWGDYPIGYYKTPFINQLISKEQELDCVYKYYGKHNIETDYPGNSIMFMKHDGKYVGFFALNVIENRLESHIGGILKPYQRDGHFVDMQEFIRRFCMDNNLNYFCFGARNENSRVQSIFRKFGYKSYGTENVFHLTPLLSFSSLDPITGTIQVLGNNNLEKKAAILRFAIKSNIGFRGNNLEFKMNSLNRLSEGSYEIHITSPLENNSSFFKTIKILDLKTLELLSWGVLTGTG